MKKRQSWDPFDDLARMHEELDRTFGRLFETSKPLLGYGGQQLQKLAGVRSPISDVSETESSVIASFEIPGVDKRDIELNVHANSIEVKVGKKLEKEIKKKGMYSYESQSKSYYRLLPLPAEVKAEKSEASYKNGILRVEIPKVTPSKKAKGTKVLVK